ncbi:hypothetical protein [Phenylobacterium sp.]|uniref:hypothetical protein n=1 Tax=Phenylobacterium sp. TaxID=1871053 RepID=UPI0027322B00|nr:hypothetical protein [Phenylobacterium sp.]MDP1617490.1 hypothetical protein [Phenylobacterium sp.]
MSRRDAILVEADLISAEGQARTLRFADRAVRPFPPGDSLRANAAWDDRLIEAPTLRRALFEDLASLAPGLGVGVMTLANGDRRLDPYSAYSWGQVRVWRWPIGADFAAATLVFTGEALPPAFGLSSTAPSRVRLGLIDARSELDRPAQSQTYAGTNGEAGVLYEGEAGGLKGRTKPLAFGDLTGAHLPSAQVNAGAGVHQLHDGPVAGDELVFDRGGPAGYLDEGDLSGGAFDAALPAAASYVTDHGRGLLKLNGEPVGMLTFGLKGDAAGGYVETAGPILARILARSGVPAHRIGDSITGLSSNAVLGLWDGQGESAATLAALVARSALAALLPDRAGVWQAISFGPPAEVEALTIGPDQVVAISADDSAPLPAAEVKVGWGRVYTTLDASDLAPSLRNTPTAEALAQDYRWAIAIDPEVKARRPATWRSAEVMTALRHEADAEALAAALLALFGARPDGRARRQFRVVLDISEAILATPLGTTVRLALPDMGLDERMVLIAEEPFRPSRDRITWTVWG